MVRICVMTTIPSSTSPLATSSETISESGRMTLASMALLIPSRSSRPSRYTPLPTLRYAMDFALSSARVKASTVLMSGLGLPALTSMPMPDRAIAVRVFATILPSRIHSSIGAEPVIRRSNGSPAVARRRNAGGKSVVTINRCAVARSNSAPISASTVAIARVVQTVMSAAAAIPGSARVAERTTATMRLRAMAPLSVDHKDWTGQQGHPRLD